MVLFFIRGVHRAGLNFSLEEVAWEHIIGQYLGSPSYKNGCKDQSAENKREVLFLALLT